MSSRQGDWRLPGWRAPPRSALQSEKADDLEWWKGLWAGQEGGRCHVVRFVARCAKQRSSTLSRALFFHLRLQSALHLHRPGRLSSTKSSNTWVAAAA